MEPFMRLEVTIEDRYLHAVLGDFAKHRSDIIEVSERHELKVSPVFSNISVTSEGNDISCRLFWPKALYRNCEDIPNEFAF